MDFSTGQIIDIVHNRWHSTLESYFLSIPLKERLNVKGVISDAYKAYLTMPEEFFLMRSQSSTLFMWLKLSFSNECLYLQSNEEIQEKRRTKAKRKNHDTNRDDKSIKPSKEVILLQNYKWVILKTVMRSIILQRDIIIKCLV